LVSGASLISLAILRQQQRIHGIRVAADDVGGFAAAAIAFAHLRTREAGFEQVVLLGEALRPVYLATLRMTRFSIDH